MKSYDQYFKMLAYFILGDSSFFFLLFAVQKTKVLLLLCEDFSAEASVGAHANTCSVKECH